MVINKQLRLKLVVSFDTSNNTFTSTTGLWTGASQAELYHNEQSISSTFNNHKELTHRLLIELYEVIAQYSNTNKNRIDLLKLETNSDNLISAFDDIIKVVAAAKKLRRYKKSYAAMVSNKLGKDSVNEAIALKLLTIDGETSIIKFALTKIDARRNAQVTNETTAKVIPIKPKLTEVTTQMAPNYAYKDGEVKQLANNVAYELLNDAPDDQVEYSTDKLGAALRSLCGRSNNKLTFTPDLVTAVIALACKNINAADKTTGRNQLLKALNIG